MESFRNQDMKAEQGSGVRSLKKLDFTIVKAMLIEKSDIRLALEKQGLDKTGLIYCSRKIEQCSKKTRVGKKKNLLII